MTVQTFNSTNNSYTMAKSTSIYTTRLNYFQQVFDKDENLKTVFSNLYTENRGNWEAIKVHLNAENGFDTPEVIQQIHLTNDLVSWSRDNSQLIAFFQEDKKIQSIRDIALNYDGSGITELLNKKKITIPAGKDTAAYAAELHSSLFAAAPSAVLQRMMSADKESPIADTGLRSSVATFLNNQPEFNIKSTSVYDAIKLPEAFKGITEQKEVVIGQLKTLQRIAAISPVPEAVTVLMKANINTAFRVSEMPQEQFVKTFAGQLGEGGEAIALKIHQNAVNSRVQNEQALIAIRETGKGTGISFIDKSLNIGTQQQYQEDGQQQRQNKTAKDPADGTAAGPAAGMAAFATLESKKIMISQVKEKLEKNNLSWDLLFADADFCECEECTSVYSAAAYYVDLLQYLRNNNLDAVGTGMNAVKIADAKDISGTALEKLFKRRPDLGCLELTCKNTNTVLPYVDLVNEVMENYVVFQETKPVFNVGEETTAELLAQPQHINYDAYCMLHKAVYPFSLPYHQPVDAIRIFLDHLGTSRHELIDVYRSPRKAAEHEPEADQLLLDNLHSAYLDRAYGAEFLGLTQEEYVILTKEGFVTKAYWDKRCKKDHTLEEYQEEIGLKPVYEYYGYDSVTTMLDDDEGTQVGLSFVKKQFLKRSGIAFSELVALLKTEYLNPMMPEGRARSLMESLHFSYRYLQGLVNYAAGSPKEKFKKLIAFLQNAEQLIALGLAASKDDPCQPQTSSCTDLREIEQWVYCYFERIGKVIVLEDGCHCVNGTFQQAKGNGEAIMLNDYRFSIVVKDCVIYYVIDKEGAPEQKLGEIDCKTGVISWIAGQERATAATFEGMSLHYNNKIIGVVKNNRLIRIDFTETCDISKTRLVHLDGTPLEEYEFDKFQRIIRLWHKLGWTIAETDSAIIGLGAAVDCGCNEGMPEEDCEDCGSLTEDCDCDTNQEDAGGCADPALLKKVLQADISPELLSQLVSVKKLMDKTGLELIKLLSLWADISTFGEQSLYKRLFLTHNLTAIDKVFQEDKNGVYLAGTAKLSDHIAVIMAALNLNALDIDAIIAYEQLEDELSPANISMLYRYRLMAKVLGLRIPDLIAVLPVFGQVFKDAAATLVFLDQWTIIEDAGFNYRQLNYVISNTDDPLKPLAPGLMAVLKLGKTIYDGINAINDTYRDLQPDPSIADPEMQQLTLEAWATSELIRSDAALIYTQPLIDAIMGILEGSTIYTTNAPKSLDVTIPEDKSLSKKLKYDRVNGAVQITGILTAAETADYVALHNDPLWAASLTRIGKQQQKLFKELLSGLFSDIEQDLMAGDINMKLEPLEDGAFAPDQNTGPKKRLRFLQLFLPYLREELIRKLITETLSGLTGMDQECTAVLMTRILKSGTPEETLYTIFRGIQSAAIPAASSWQGYLIPAAGNNYTFIAKNADVMPVITLNGKTIMLQQQEDPTNEWWAAAPETLQGGQLYDLQINGLSADLKDLLWKTDTTLPATIPAAMLLPDFVQQKTMEAFVSLKKAAIWVNGFNLDAAEISWFFDHAADFGEINFNAVGLKQFLRMADYARLRNTIPEAGISLLAFFKWAVAPDNPASLTEKISSLTNWKKEQLDLLLSDMHFNLNNPDYFRNEINLLKLQRAVQVAEKIGMPADLLFNWAKPSSHFNKCHLIAESIRKAIRAQYLQDDWEQVVKPLNDQLRENQKNALVAYLLVQQPLMDWGVRDADGLFEFFLIDVQMCTCMETSRIKQAISSVQLFVQRCLLGLEESYGIKPEVLDRDRWEWMQRYRVWEANRKVFLYPENWIESNLRDDKSPFFKELEGELLQKDINKQNVTDALKSYLYKIDEVAHMEVVGLHIESVEGVENMEGGNKDGHWAEGSKLHVFSRTRNAPYFFYYRYLALDEGNWYAWEKMQVDIPSYDLDDDQGQVTSNGTYLIPVSWNGRLLLFFPQISKKTYPVNLATTGNTSTDGAGNMVIPVAATKDYWEIKMGWSEYRNGKWTQKQLSKESVKKDTAFYKRPAESGNNHSSIDFFDFFPDAADDRVQIRISANIAGSAPLEQGFNFDGHTISTSAISAVNFPAPKEDFDGPFHYFEKKAKNNNGEYEYELHSLQTSGKNPFYAQEEPYFYLNDEETTIELDGNSFPFYFANIKSLTKKINTQSLSKFFNYHPSSDLQDIFGGAADGLGNKIFHELKRPYALYNWELFFHTPLMLADALSKAQQFEEAMNWYHFVFNPMASGTDDKRFWEFTPFKEIDAEHILDKIFNQLQPNTPNAEISEWRNHPFMPHLVARSRPVAYMKWVVMKYIDNLVAWGDYLFRQDTIESINQATQLYILGSHILGKRPEFIPKRGKIKPQTYLSMLGKWDAFSNAVTELELAAPFSSQTDQPLVVNGAKNGVAFANIFGFSSALYFCIPNNPKLSGYWDTLADRLYKIRHCENIEGVFRKLPLFEPPIDPALLVKAVAQGLSISSVINDLNTPMPNYRFYFLLQKALELCAELKVLGNSMLSAMEKQDNEAISLIRSRHEGVMNNLVMELRKQQLDEAQKALEGLVENRRAPEQRMKYYLQLIGEDPNKVPAFDADYTELTNPIEVPVDESGLKLIKYEKEDMDKASESADFNRFSGISEALAGGFHLIPNFGTDAKPFGVGAGFFWGGTFMGAAAQAVAKGLQVRAGDLSHASGSAGKKGGFQRAMQDRIMQANTAGREIKQIDKQITAQQIRIQIAGQEITNQQKLMDNTQEMEEFLKNKYSNEELYSWMKGSLRSLYHQVYSLGYELAKKAEKVYRFERGLSNSNFIQAGYWEEGRDGLLSGEQLYVNLKQLEAAYQEKNGYDYEITKHVSLRKINPLAVLQLKETGKCEFDLPEVLFDMDFPGHYGRRLKSVSLSIPCIAGPYTGLNATLRLLNNKFRSSAMVKDANDYPEKTEESDDRFSSFIIPVAAIAASSGQNDSGMFELNFKDERYLPFEGAGAISQWRLDLPSFRQFDYDTISDVILHLHYVASEGGDRLQKAASGNVKTMLKSIEGLGKTDGFFAVVDLKHDLPNEWHKAVQLITEDHTLMLPLDKILEFLPYYTKVKPDGSVRDLKKINAGDVTVVIQTEAHPSLSIEQQDNSFAFSPAANIGDNLVFVCQTDEAKLDNWSLKMSNMDKEISKMFMVVRYVLKD